MLYGISSFLGTYMAKRSPKTSGWRLDFGAVFRGIERLIAFAGGWAGLFAALGAIGGFLGSFVLFLERSAIVSLDSLSTPVAAAIVIGAYALLAFGIVAYVSAIILFGRRRLRVDVDDNQLLMIEERGWREREWAALLRHMVTLIDGNFHRLMRSKDWNSLAQVVRVASEDSPNQEAWRAALYAYLDNDQASAFVVEGRKRLERNAQRQRPITYTEFTEISKNFWKSVEGLVNLYNLIGREMLGVKRGDVPDPNSPVYRRVSHILSDFDEHFIYFMDEVYRIDRGVGMRSGARHSLRVFPEWGAVLDLDPETYMAELREFAKAA